MQKILITLSFLMLAVSLGAHSAGATIHAQGPKDPVEALQATISHQQAVLAAPGYRKNLYEWARLNLRLGEARYRLALLTKNPDLLEQAVKNFDATLTVWTKKSKPQAWAVIEFDRGSALTMLGGARHRMDDLTKAVAAFQAALEILSRKPHSYSYGMTERMLAQALLEEAGIEHSPASLEASIAAAKAAAETWQATNNQRELILAQFVLGKIYYLKGMLTKNRDDIRKAADIQRSVLAAKDPKQEPEQAAEWAATFGDEMRDLGMHDHNLAELDDAARAYRSAIAIWTKPTDDLARSKVQSLLGSVLIRQAVWNNRPEMLYDAISTYESALAHWPAQMERDQWASAEAGHGDALAELGRIYRLPARFLAANDAYRTALTVWSPGHLPDAYSVANRHLGASFMYLAISTHKPDYAQQGIDAYKAALSVKNDAKNEAEIQGLIVRAEAQLKRLQAKR